MNSLLSLKCFSNQQMKDLRLLLLLAKQYSHRKTTDAKLTDFQISIVLRYIHIISSLTTEHYNTLQENVRSEKKAVIAEFNSKF